MINQWKDELRRRMEHHEESAPKGLWEDIELIMKEQSMPPLQKKRGTRYWYLGTAAAAAIALLVIGLNVFMQNRENIQPLPSHETQHSQQSVRTYSPTYKDTLKSIIKESLLADKSEKRNKEVTKPNYSSLKTNTVKKEEEVLPEERESIAVKEENTANQETSFEEETPSQTQIADNNNRTSSQNIFHLPKNKSRRNRLKWQTDFYASNISGSSTQHYGGYHNVSLNNLLSASDNDQTIESASLPKDIIRLNEYQQVYSDIKHLTPIMAGVSVKYHFAPRWSVASGVNYTILISELRSGSDNYYYNSRQTLHYIGLPLNINYAVWEKGKIFTYISVGGLVEKNVWGTLSTNYTIDQQVETPNQQKIEIEQLQWSINTAAGIEYKLSNLVGIYAEPGVAYYFNNKSTIETIHKEKPLNFNLKLGLRFSINE